MLKYNSKSCQPYYCLYNIILAAYSVRVGIQQTDYTVDEVDSYQLVCVGVSSGQIAGRELIFHYSTASGTASMIMIAINI